MKTKNMDREMKKVKGEFSDVLFFVSILIVIGIVLYIAPSGLDALGVVGLTLVGMAMILITKFYSKYAKLTFRS
ncbi:MAG TPA: hypothetical protein HA346_01075 [Thermoplasmata archaeon]|nr:hypothetical protein [Thermoplasmata archaeon]